MREDSQQIRSANVIYEDAQLVVCIKPRGVLSCKDASGKESMHDLLAPREIYPIHRLDREVTGVMVFAKDAKTAAFLSQHEGFVKEYRARCEGHVSPEEGELTDLLFHDRSKNKTYVVKRERGGVKKARLSYRVIGYDGDTSLVQIRLFTGRTHQIRVQFASRSYPLCGDRKYGAKTNGDIALEAFRLSFTHPNGQTLSFSLGD